MNTPAPLPLTQSTTLVPSLADKASLFVGGPLAGLGAYMWVDLMRLDPTHLTQADIAVAATAGGVLATVLGYLGHALKVLIDRRIANA